MGKPMNQIAKDIGRDKSTISREIGRNSDQWGYLYPGMAHQASLDRKNKNIGKFQKHYDMKAFVIKMLQEKWSPKTISDEWSVMHNDKKIGHEAIYQWIYSREGRQLKMHKFLIRAHKKRGLKRKAKKASKIKNRISVHDRPEVINNRSETGHLEADLIFNKGSMSQNVCTLIDRVTRRAILIKNKSKHSDIVIDGIIQEIKQLGLNVKSITFDNGSEFAKHTKLNEMGIDTYFCDPGSPWQKGAIEHLNGMLRRYLPFKMLATQITNDMVQQANKKINNMPRAILGYKTPLEVSSGAAYA
jgi:IS30 family transposase